MNEQNTVVRWLQRELEKHWHYKDQPSQRVNLFNLNILRVYLSLRSMLFTICYIHYIIRRGSNSYVFSLHLNGACLILSGLSCPGPSFRLQFIFSRNILIGSPSRHETHNTTLNILLTRTEFHSLKEVLEMMEYPSTAMWHFLHSDRAPGWWVVPPPDLLRCQTNDLVWKYRQLFLSSSYQFFWQK